MAQEDDPVEGSDENSELAEQINELYSMTLDGDIQNIYDFNAIADFKLSLDAGRSFTGPQVNYIERMYSRYIEGSRD